MSEANILYVNKMVFACSVIQLSTLLTKDNCSGHLFMTIPHSKPVHYQLRSNTSCLLSVTWIIQSGTC